MDEIIVGVFFFAVITFLFLAGYGLFHLFTLLLWKFTARERRARGYYAVGRVL